jgi:hypothetical protein
MLIVVAGDDARRMARRRDRFSRDVRADAARSPTLRRRHRLACPRPRRLPRAPAGAVGRSHHPRHAGAHHAGRLDVAPDPRAPRFRARRSPPHAAGRVRQARSASEFDFAGTFDLGLAGVAEEPSGDMGPAHSFRATMWKTCQCLGSPSAVCPFSSISSKRST